MVSPRVLTLGEMLFDLIADQPGLPYLAVESWSAYPGGAPANVATALAKLGTPAAWIGCLGLDGEGDRLVEVLAERGVDLVGVQRHPTAPTRQVYVTRTVEGDRQFAGFGEIASEDFADADLEGDRLPVQLFEQADYLVLGTLGLAYLKSRAAMQTAVALAQHAGMQILIDVNWRPVFWADPVAAQPVIRSFLLAADWLKLSDDEAHWLFGTTEPAAIAQAVRALDQQRSPSTSHRLKGVIVTAGAQGCEYLIGPHSGKLPAFRVDVVDTTGAGDSFVAGLLHRFCQYPSDFADDFSDYLDADFSDVDCLDADCLNLARSDRTAPLAQSALQSERLADRLAQIDPSAPIAGMSAVDIHQCLLYASAVGALTTIRAGAIEAQPTAEEVEAFLYLHTQMEKNHGHRD